MDIFNILAIAIGLSFDTFAVSLSYGVVRNSIPFGQATRIALVFALFQGGLTITGFFLGSLFSNAVDEADHWIAFGLLAIMGIKMIIEGFKRDESGIKDTHNIFVLYAVALLTSIDAFAVGISFALLNVQIWWTGILIGAVTFIASMMAIRIGKSAGARLGHRVEILGGIILFSIGLKILLEHTIV